MYPKNIISQFKELYSKTPTLVVRGPGRINLIGEHTDYNDGFVLPAAIDKAIYFAIAPREDDNCNIYAFDLNSSDTFNISTIRKSDKSWANYLIGVVDELQKAGQKIKGFDLVFGGDIPLGAGVSSSAAVETGLAFALNQLYALGLETMQMVKIGKAAENNFVGVNCGIMDQFASMFGKKDTVIRLDCRSLEYQHFPLSLPNHTVILCNSGVKHSLGDSEYNTRRLECEEGLRILGGIYPNVKSFRDLTLAMVEEAKASLSENVFKRCVYVVGEIDRVIVACEALERNDLATFGKKMYETHDGLQHNYEVSCEELDFLVDQTREDDGVVGSRMMGGGFGGCSINIVEKSKTEAFLLRIKRAYQAKYQKDLVTYTVALMNGTEVI
jgi:galactokinase